MPHIPEGDLLSRARWVQRGVDDYGHPFFDSQFVAIIGELVSEIERQRRGAQSLVDVP